MTAYSFNKQFIGPILAGTKSQTIRPVGKRHHARQGREVQLYTAMRTKYCRLIGRATCLYTVRVTLDFPANNVMVGEAHYEGWNNLDTFAKQDGFDGWLTMREFWNEHHADKPVFTGILIRWDGVRQRSLPDAIHSPVQSDGWRHRLYSHRRRCRRRNHWQPVHELTQRCDLCRGLPDHADRHIGGRGDCYDVGGGSCGSYGAV